MNLPPLNKNQLALLKAIVAFHLEHKIPPNINQLPDVIPRSKLQNVISSLIRAGYLTRAPQYGAALRAIYTADGRRVVIFVELIEEDQT